MAAGAKVGREQIKAGIVCPNCGARYSRLLAYTCLRCGAPLCPTGCDGCTAACPLRPKQAK